MYNVMLAEDEPEVLSAMLSTIQWKKFGFEMPVGCRDGNEAIDALKRGFKPAVLITDICMPFTDGMALTRYINEESPGTIVVILTGYDDFKYAQEAVKLQVYDYLLKPVTPNRINELLQRLKNELDKRKFSVAEDSLQIVSSYFLNRLITKRLDNSIIEENCRLHKLNFEGRYHIVAVMDVDLPTPITIDDENNRELMRYGLFNISQELTAQDDGVIVFQGRGGTTKLIFSAQSPDECYEAATSTAGLVAGILRDNLKICASAGIGEPVAYLDELFNSHIQSQDALRYRFFYGEASVICQADIDVKQSREVEYSKVEHAFIASIKAFDREKAYEIIAAFIMQLKNNHIAFDKCILYSQKLIMSLINLTNEIVGEQEVAPLEKIAEDVRFLNVSTIARLEEMIQKICGKAFELFEAVRSDSAASQVLKAETYIKEHYNEPELSLNTITEHLSISTSYFSAIFKSKTGTTFVEYLTRLRIDKAKQILAFTDLRTYEAAESVGIADPHYFSVTFKRVTGMTPKEYREQCHDTIPTQSMSEEKGSG